MKNKYILELIEQSPHKAVKWIKDLDDGFTYFWPAGPLNHSDIAKAFNIVEYEKGIIVND